MNVLEQPSDDHLVLEFIHVDTSFVNALRRILLAEVPTVGLESIYLYDNTSIIHDEVLAHRLGLIPLDVDARLLDDPDPDDDSPTDRNTVVFRLQAECTHEEAKKAAEKKEKEDEDDDDSDIEESYRESIHVAQAGTKYHPPEDRPYTKHVYSKDLQWVPQGDQEERIKVKPLHDDILIAKLRPGQAIELEAHGRRGVGKDHAKYSPVATASYRLHARIELLHEIYDENAEQLVHVYEPGVFALVAADGPDDPPGARVKAVVQNPYACTMSRNFMRNPVLKKSIRMSRIADHFIFSIESVGAYKPAVLLAEALRVLQGKCQNLIHNLEEHDKEAS